MPKPIWKPATYKFYDGRELDLSSVLEVSNYGQLRNKKDHNKPVITYDRGKWNANTGGKTKRYRVLQRKGHTLSVHRIVLSTFKPEEYVEGWDVAHIDHNAVNNRLSNLKWQCPIENNKDKPKK